ncbi:MAG: hypothetical protein ACQEP5_07535 [Actinomycetota bacterium]
MIIKISLAIRFRARVLDSLFTPVSLLYIASIAAVSAFEYRMGRGIQWKGRNYNFTGKEGMRVVEDK